MNTIPSPLLDTFEVYVASRFFGLAELESFAKSSIEPYAGDKAETTLILDFSAVRIWDISALLWLTVALEHYRRNKGLRFRLRLPESKSSMPGQTKDEIDRSADFLRRWRFDTALGVISEDIPSLLVPEQKDYFLPSEPRRYYPVTKVTDTSNLLQSLISRRLTEIRSLSDPSFVGSSPISEGNIAKRIREFQAERIGDILSVQCGIEPRIADLFADHLLTEALLNVQEHPQATIGLVAISIMGNSNELILSVADNGLPIPQTIYERFIRDVEDESASPQYSAMQLGAEKLAAITHHATKQGVTRKTGPQLETLNAGMGLTYIKEDCVGKFSGKLSIITAGVRLRYSGDPHKQPPYEEWNHSWAGNLLRIAIPIPRPDDDCTSKGQLLGERH